METAETALVKARRLGGSIIVSIPKTIVEHEGIVPGESIKITIKKARTSWFGALKGVGPMAREDEFDGQIRD
jgi:antitoxin component of MazEF toxin-antitoxin module